MLKSGTQRAVLCFERFVDINISILITPHRQMALAESGQRFTNNDPVCADDLGQFTIAGDTTQYANYSLLLNNASHRHLR